MPADDVLLEVENGIATITLNRPGSMNALSDDIKEGIAEALDEIADHESAKCVVFEGAGDAFSAGGDVKSMDDEDSDTSGHSDTLSMMNTVEQIPLRIYNYELPTVAKVDGYCVGAGVGLAMSCDIVVASSGSGFGLVFRNVGLSLDWLTSYFVMRAVGPYTAKELAYTGDIISATEADEMGLINHAYPDGEFESEARELIEQIAAGPTIALYYSAQNIDRAFNGTPRDAGEREAFAQNIARNTSDHTEGVQAFKEGRDPSFEGL
jgi:enoyl-CoA hydratase/carnithine racemase